eukprot:TRINITY_DN4260_c0_g3_i1.p1 TRINITY_DN4260_c0_g3~~TRINITY_DN4260_c0_g3_i1.p1  ORF type:complete len:229 (-),score=56.95 TRINITY_DN4260_c0_g3_i1:27-713(-)
MADQHRAFGAWVFQVPNTQSTTALLQSQSFTHPGEVRLPFPQNCKRALVKLWGGGGAGGGGWHAGICNLNAGGGGGAGGYTETTVVPRFSGQFLHIKIGAGGTGIPGAGSNGENTTLYVDGVTIAKAKGGMGGHAYGSAASPTSGTGGLGSIATGGPGTPGMTYQQYPGSPYTGPIGKGGDAHQGGAGGLGGWNNGGQPGVAPGGGGGGGTGRVGSNGGHGCAFIEFY